MFAPSRADYPELAVGDVAGHTVALSVVQGGGYFARNDGTARSISATRSFPGQTEAVRSAVSSYFALEREAVVRLHPPRTCRGVV